MVINLKEGGMRMAANFEADAAVRFGSLHAGIFMCEIYADLSNN